MGVLGKFEKVFVGMWGGGFMMGTNSEQIIKTLELSQKQLNRSINVRLKQYTLKL